ncbi:hypothetical protein H4I96_12062 [Botrytis cinerea]
MMTYQHIGPSTKKQSLIPSPGTMNITARNDGTLIFHHIPAARSGFSYRGIAGGFDDGDNVTGLTAEARQENLRQTKLRL